MNKILKSLAFAALATCSSVASANLYIGGNVGLTDVGLDGYDEATSYSFTAGLDLSSYFALEASYINFGEAEDDSFFPTWIVSSEGFNAALVGRLPVTDQISLFAKVGAFAWEAELEEEGWGLLDDDEGVDLSVAAGVNIALAQNVELNAQYMRIDLDVAEVDNLSAGVTFRF
jgi:OmpA-OmpF porin, OOP family